MRSHHIVSALIPELLAQDALLQAVAGIEEKIRGDATVHMDFDCMHAAHLDMIGDRGDRSPLGRKHLDLHSGGVGQ